MHKKSVLKNFPVFTAKHLCWNLLFNKNASLQVCSFIKKRLQYRSFFHTNIEKFLRAPILKNICERLLLRVFLEHFPTWTNNIGSQEDVFSKTKQNKTKSTVLKLSYMKKTCHFMFFIISFFSISSLHVSRSLLYTIKDGSSESFETA